MVKKIISGQTYNTDTATRVHEFTYHGDDCYQGLFQTRHGAFFLWEYDAGASWGDLKPLSDEEARKWLEQHANHLLEQYFGPFPEGGAAERRLTVRLPANLARRLEALAEEKGLSLNSYVMRCFEKCAAADGHGVAIS
jgi:predicted HicB family RNase H-like nuclease